MSSDRDTTRIVRSWLEEGATALPDRVLDAVLDQVPATPQRRAWWPAWRFFHMNNTVRFALAAAVVVVLAFVGIRFLLPGQNVGPPGPTSTPTPMPSPQLLQGVASDLEPGSYSMSHAAWAPVRFTFTVPAGWAVSGDGFVIKHQAEPGEVAFSSWSVTHVFANACHWQGTSVEVGTTVDELATALAGQQERVTSGPTDVTLAGLPAKRIELSAPADFEITTCDNAFIRTWPETGGDEGGGWGARAGQTDVVYVLDLGGERFVMNTWHFQGTPEADLTELEGIIASIHFEP